MYKKLLIAATTLLFLLTPAVAQASESGPCPETEYRPEPGCFYYLQKKPRAINPLPVEPYAQYLVPGPGAFEYDDFGESSGYGFGEPSQDCLEAIHLGYTCHLRYPGLQLVNEYPHPKSLTGLTGAARKAVEMENAKELGKILAENSVAKWESGVYSICYDVTGGGCANGVQLTEAQNVIIAQYNLLHYPYYPREIAEKNATIAKENEAKSPGKEKELADRYILEVNKLHCELWYPGDQCTA